MSIGSYFLLKNYFYQRINYTFFRLYQYGSLVIITIAIISGIIATIKGVEQRYNVEKQDMKIMKNIGGKDKWIYSYMILNHIINASITLILGIITGMITIVIIYGIFGFIKYVGLISLPVVLGSNLTIFLIYCFIAHNQVIGHIKEEDFEKSSKNISKYKSIIEFEGIIGKIPTTMKVGMKNFLRSSEIRKSLIFTIIIVTSLLICITAPLLINNNYNTHYQKKDLSYYIIGEYDVVKYYQKQVNINQYFNESSNINGTYQGMLAETFIQSLEKINQNFNKNYISRVYGKEKTYYEIDVNSYKSIGKNRSFYITILGIQQDQFKQIERIDGEVPQKINEILIGDSIDKYFIQNSFLQKIVFENKEYKITGITNNVFSGGFCIYGKFNTFIQNNITKNPNIITIPVENLSNDNEIIKLIQQYNYTMEKITYEIENNKELVGIQNVYTITNSLIYIVISFKIIYFGIMYIREYEEDIKILIKVGINKKKISKIFLTALFCHTMPGTIIGMYCGYIITKFFIIQKTNHNKIIILNLILTLIWSIILQITGNNWSLNGIE